MKEKTVESSLVKKEIYEIMKEYNTETLVNDDDAIDHNKLAEIYNFTPDEIKYLKIFWNTAYKSDLLPIDKEMINKWFNITSRNPISSFNKKLNAFEQGYDYKEVPAKTSEFAKKNFAVSSDCLKVLLIESSEGNRIRKIFNKIEELVATLKNCKYKKINDELDKALINNKILTELKNAISLELETEKNINHHHIKTIDNNLKEIENCKKLIKELQSKLDKKEKITLLIEKIKKFFIDLFSL
jgi:hypothetical protein